jgi:hypothetical protein
MDKRKDLMMVLGMDVMTCTLPNIGEKKKRADLAVAVENARTFARLSGVIT